MRKRLAKYIFQNQILTALLVIAATWLVIEVRDVLIAFFVAYILMAAIEPYSNFLEKKRVPRAFAAAIPYFISVALIFVVILSLLPFLISQIQLLLSSFPAYLYREAKLLGVAIDASQLTTFAASEINNIGSGALSITSKIFGSIFSIISVFAISFYLLLYRETVRRSFVTLFPKKSAEKVKRTTVLVEDKLGSWLRGQIVLSFVIGMLTWFVLTVLGIEFALPLAVIAGVFELVPTIGPIISAIPALIVAFNISLTMAGAVGISYVFIQLIENHVVVPRVMQRAVGLNPIVIILAIITGGKLLGIIGALLAIPFISLLVVVYKNLD